MPHTFNIGDRVVYRRRFKFVGFGTIMSQGIEAGLVVYDIALDCESTTRWGYAEQFTPLIELKIAAE